MTNEVTPEPLENEVKADIIMDLATKFNLTLPNAAGVLEFFLDKGWNPPVLTEFDLDFNQVALLPDVEVGDMMMRIVHGLPMVPPKTSAYMDEIGKIYDVNSLHPQEVVLTDIVSLHPAVVNDWTRIPDFDNYEINKLGLVRNRWTKRVLEFVDDGEDNEDYVEMHDKEGFAHICHVGYLKERTFKD